MAICLQQANQLRTSFANALVKMPGDRLLDKIKGAYHPKSYQIIIFDILGRLNSETFPIHAKFFIHEYRSILEQALAGRLYALQDRVGEVVSFENQIAMQKALFSFYNFSKLIIPEFQIKTPADGMVDPSPQELGYYFHVTMASNTQYYQAYNLINIPFYDVFEPEVCLLYLIHELANCYCARQYNDLICRTFGKLMAIKGGRRIIRSTVQEIMADLHTIAVLERYSQVLANRYINDIYSRILSILGYHFDSDVDHGAPTEATEFHNFVRLLWFDLHYAHRIKEDFNSHGSAFLGKHSSWKNAVRQGILDKIVFHDQPRPADTHLKSLFKIIEGIFLQIKPFESRIDVYRLLSEEGP